MTIYSGRLCVTFIILILVPPCLLASPQITKPIHVTFINPGHASVDNPTGQFWPEAGQFAQAVADDLGIKLEILYGNRDRVHLRQLLMDVIKRDHKPDYLLLVNERFALTSLFDAVDKSAIPFFLAYNHYSKFINRPQPTPREYHKYWLGSLLPDNEYAGYRLAKMLIASTGGKPAKFLAYSGDTVTSASLLRTQGLQRALAESPHAQLARLVPGEWRYDIPEQRTVSFLQRQPDINLIWAANGAMGLGAIKGVDKRDTREESTSINKPARSITIASINWDADEIAALQQGQLYASVGGHFMTAGWSLIMLYDYHHGHDFAADGGVYQQRKIFEAVTRDTVPEYLPVLSTRQWDSLNFKVMSKTYNPDLQYYQFNLGTLLKRNQNNKPGPMRK